MAASDDELKQTLIKSLRSLLTVLETCSTKDATTTAPTPTEPTAPPPPEEPRALWDAIHARKKKLAMKLLDHPDAKTFVSHIFRGSTPLLWAAFRNYYDITYRMLADFGSACLVYYMEDDGECILNYIDSAQWDFGNKITLTKMVIDLMHPDEFINILTRCAAFKSSAALKMYAMIFKKRPISRSVIASIITRSGEAEVVNALLRHWEQAEA